MKRIIFLIGGFFLFIFLNCQPPAEPQPKKPEPRSLSKNESRLVSLGDSLTMGIMDGGLAESFQRNCYPYLIAQQWGEADEFQQPYIMEPGIGVPPFVKPLDWVSDEIVWEMDPEPDFTTVVIEVLNKLANPGLDRPYNNLGVNGAKLSDLLYTTTYAEAGNNFFFDIVLRNLTVPVSSVFKFKGTTMVSQATLLDPAPEIILLWIGNNDVLGSLLAGGDESLLTDPMIFEIEYRRVLDDLKEITDRIVLANIPDYIPFPYALDGAKMLQGEDEVFMLFDSLDFTPLDFGAGTFYPLWLEEEDAVHVTLYGGVSYLEEGYGVDPGTGAAAAWESEFGIPPVGEPIPGEYTITPTEFDAMIQAISDFNAIIEDLAGPSEYDLPLADTNGLINQVKDGSYPNPNYSHEYIYLAAGEGKDTIFSLDGVHTSYLGHALIANVFIQKMNETWNLGIELLDPENYTDQYSGNLVYSRALEAIKRVRQMYLDSSERKHTSP